MENLDQAFDDLAKALIHSTKMSHTTVVVTAAAILEHDLERCIKTKMRPLKKDMENRLFGAGGYGPISSFAAKIDLSYALDITTTDIHRELQLIRKIRNTFSHSQVRLSLDEEPVKFLFYSLTRPPGISGTYAAQFVQCIRVLDDYLEAFLVRMGETEGLRLTQRKAAG